MVSQAARVEAQAQTTDPAFAVIVAGENEILVMVSTSTFAVDPESDQASYRSASCCSHQSNYLNSGAALEMALVPAFTVFCLD